MSPLHAIQPRAETRHHQDQPSQEFRYGWIGPVDAMAHLSIRSRSMLYRAIKEWQLPCSRLGRLYRFRRADLDQWMAQQGRTFLAAHRSV